MWDASGYFLWRISVITLLTENEQIRYFNTWERVFFKGVSSAPFLKGAGPRVPNFFLDPLSVPCISFDLDRPDSVWKSEGSGMFQQGQARFLSLREWGRQQPQIFSTSIHAYAHTVWHTATKLRIIIIIIIIIIITYSDRTIWQENFYRHATTPPAWPNFCNINADDQFVCGS